MLRSRVGLRMMTMVVGGSGVSKEEDEVSRGVKRCEVRGEIKGELK